MRFKKKLKNKRAEEKQHNTSLTYKHATNQTITKDIRKK